VVGREAAHGLLLSMCGQRIRSHPYVALVFHRDDDTDSLKPPFIQKREPTFLKLAPLDSFILIIYV